MRRLVAFVVSALLLALCSCGQERRVAPVALDGQIDLSDWRFDTDGIVSLEGQWRFTWEELLEPMPTTFFRERYKSNIEVPGAWRTQAHPTVAGSLMPGLGYATYMLEVKLPPGSNNQDYAVSISAQASASRLYITDSGGENILAQVEQGRVGAAPEASHPLEVPAYAGFRASDNNSILVWLQLSNFYFPRGGMTGIVRLGLRQDVLESENSTLILDVTVFGMCLIIALYHFLLFTQRHEDQSSLFFACFCAFFAVRQWCTGKFGQAMGYGDSLGGWEALTLIEYASLPLIAMVAGLFLQSLLNDEVFKRIVYVAGVGFGGLLVALTCVVSPSVFTDYLNLFHIQILVCAFFGIYYLAKHSLAGNALARWVLAALGLLVGGAVHDILLSNQVFVSQYIASYSFIGFMLLQSAILSGRAAKAYRQSEHLSKNLQKEVEAQTHVLKEHAEEADTSRREALRQKAHAEMAKLEAEDLRTAAESQAERLRELDQQKTFFFQNISHELRTPLTLILNPLENQSKALPGNSDIGLALRNARRLLRLVNQLLDFQKLSAGKQELQLTPIDVLKFGRICGDYFSSACHSKGIAYRTTINGECLGDDYLETVYMQGCLDSLEKVVFNFLSNALKYTPSGGSITLAIDQSDDRVRLSVKDSGPGIAKEDQGKLFLVFSQVDDSTTRAFEGTGLGLALAKELTEKMDGEVGIDSELGQGSSFWADFPAAPALRSVRDILLVDDDVSLLRAWKLTFRDLGSIEVAESVDDAIELLKKFRFRIVVSDARMPKRDGTELLSYVYRHDVDTIRILMTGQADQEVLQRAVNEGQSHRIWYKPVEVPQAEQELEKFLADSSIRESRDATEEFKVKEWLLDKPAPETEAAESGADDHSDENGHQVLVVDDLHDMRQLISSTLRQSGYRLSTASHGRHGLEVARSGKPDLIITDWMMPEMSGPEMISAIRRDESLKGIPVVLLTAKSDEESKLAGKEVGADAYLGKPFNTQELLSTVRNLIQLKAKEREVKTLNHELTEHVLKRYLPPGLIEDILNGEFEFAVEPKEKLITVLFTDICGFTKLGERLSAQDYAEQLNEYLTVMNEIIFAHSGTVDKFMGDAIMVLFGAPKEMDAESQAERAVSCAQAMIVGLEGLNDAWQKRGMPELSVRMGIHQGRAVVGNFGSARRSDYTCIGAAVNLASRIESVCHPNCIFVSDIVGRLLTGEVIEVGEFELKGIDEKQVIYRVD